MRKISKKTISLIVAITFLLTTIATASALTIDNKSNTDETEIIYSTEKITIYRYGLDGKVQPIEIEVNEKDGQTIDDALMKKCDELFENDVEMQKAMNSTNKSISFFSRVTSQGKGFHYKSMLLESIAYRFILIRLGLPRLSTFLHKTIVFCKYTNDINAETTIRPILSNTTKVMEGSHSVFILNFIGYTTWIGRFSKSPFDLAPRHFSGIGRFVFCKDL